MPPSTAGELDPCLVRAYYKQIGPVQRVLDLGCGRGDVGRWKPNASVQVYGIDSDADMVSSASRFEHAQVLDLEKEKLPFDDAFFDAVLAKDILEHLQKPWVFLKEIRRVLKPGGRLLVSVPMAKPQVVWNDYSHVRGYTREAIRRMLADGGFSVQRIRKNGGIPLAGRLGLAEYIPILLMFPPFDWLWGSSFEALSIKPAR